MSTTNSPAISVVVPCFNLGAYLHEAVDSVLAQTCQDFEILVVDDGSTDPETVKILDGFDRPKTTLYRTPNRGLAAARNFLIDKARGEYLCALDADDKLHPEYLEKTKRALDADPSLTFVSSLLRMFGEEDGVWPSDDRCDLATLLCDDTVITPALVRRSAVVRVGGYDEHMPHHGDEDWDLWISLVEEGGRGIILPEVLFHYRRRANSMCIDCTTGQKHLDLIEYIVSKHRTAYASHVWHVLRWKERHLRQIRRATVDIEQYLTDQLSPALARRRAEAEALRRRLAEARTRVNHRASEGAMPSPTAAAVVPALSPTEGEYRRAMDEVAALRNSVSWRVTAPLRRSYDALLRLSAGRK